MARWVAGIWVLLAAAGLSGCGHLAARIDQGIETAGRETAGVPVEVGEVELDLLRGRVEISGLTIANPRGYQAADAFRMERLRLNIGILSLIGLDNIVLDELLVDSPVLTFEHNPQGGSNLADLADTVSSNLASDKDEHDSDEPEDDDGDPLRIAVRRLSIEGIAFRLLGADGTWMEGTLPSVQLVDVGGSEGKTLGGLGSIIVSSMARQMVFQVIAHHLGDIGDVVSSLDQEALLAACTGELGLSAEQMTQVESWIDERIACLDEALASARANGYLDLDGLVGCAGTTAEQARSQMSDILTPGQVERLEAMYREQLRLTREQIRDRLVEKMTGMLNLRPEQMQRLRPVVYDLLQERVDLLRRYLHQPEPSLDEFLSAWTDLHDETRRILTDELDPDQLEAWSQRQRAVREFIRNVSRGIVQP